MSIPLLRALAKYHKLVDKATRNPTIVVPPQLNFVPGTGEDLESMIWALTYAIMLHHQESLQGADKADYKRDVVDAFYGSLSYFGLHKERIFMVVHGINPLAEQPEEWFPDPVQCKWFRRAMTLLAHHIIPPLDGSTKEITFEAFDALCDEFITDE